MQLPLPRLHELLGPRLMNKSPIARRLLVIVLAFGFSCCALYGAEAQKGDLKAWKRYQSAGEEAFKARDSLEAEKQFTLAVEEAERLPKGESRLRESLQDLAPLLLSHRKYHQAQSAYERLRALYEKELGSNHLRVAGALIGVGQACAFGNRHAEAEGALLRARRIVETKSGALHPDIVPVHSTLAGVYRQTGRFDQAEALYKTAIQIAESPLIKTEFAGSGIQQTRYQPRYEIAAGLMNDLALLYEARSRFPEAEAMLKRALKTYEDARGAESSGAAMALHNLGIVYLRQTQFVEAERPLRRALTIREKAFGRTHPVVADTLEALAAATEPQDRQQANNLRARAREIRAGAR
jgi:tetratricopeptide (TPR) repeat protein